MIDKIHKKEIAIINFLNEIYDWNLSHTGMDYEHYDAIGYTRKGSGCIMEMKFRTTHYEDMMLEKKKYQWLMETSFPKYEHKFYLVQDPTGIYIFWLNDIDINVLTTEDMNCPPTTYFTESSKINKEVYLLPKQWASVKILNYGI